MLSILLKLLLGLFILYISGEFLIRGAILFANRYKLSSFFVGATVVAFGTSAPEFFVSVISKLKGLNGISVGNILGSNIANIAIVLGMSLLLARKTKNTANNFNIPFIELLLTTSIPFLFLLAVIYSYMPKYLSITMLILFLSFLLLGLRKSIKEPSIEEFNSPKPLWLILTLVILGSVGLPWGANIFVDGAKNIAVRLGISQLLVGVTITAFGTSLPELVASFVAILKHNAQMSIGNVLGSNIINFYGILGLVSLLFNVQIPKGMIVEFNTLSLLTVLVLMIPKLKHKLLGITMLLSYLLYFYAVIHRL